MRGMGFKQRQSDAFVYCKGSILLLNYADDIMVVGGGAIEHKSAQEQL